jgi:hypothetical protein
MRDASFCSFDFLFLRLQRFVFNNYLHTDDWHARNEFKQPLTIPSEYGTLVERRG